MSNQIGASGLPYGGVKAVQPRDWHYFPRDPNQYDNGPQYQVGDEAQNTITKTIWQLVSLAGNATSAGALADWVMVTNGGGTVISLTSNNALAILPTAGNINVVGDGVGITGFGVASPTSTITLSLVGGGQAAQTFPTDSGSALPISGVLNIKAGNSTLNSGSSVFFSGSANTVLLNVSDTLSNTIVGKLGGNLAISGANNSSLGTSALHALTTGGSNQGFGQNALMSLTTGSFNTAIGFQPLANLVSGSSNIGIGDTPGAAYVGSESNNIIIGRNDGEAGESGTIRIGNESIQTSAYMAGVFGVTPTGGTNQFVTVNSATGQFGSTTGGGGSVSSFITSPTTGTATPAAGVITVAGTFGVTATTGGSTITLSGSGVVDVVPYTPVNHSMSPYTVLGADYYLGCDVTAGVISILLPNAPATGRVFIIKDKVGLAATSNITVTTVGGAVNIDGATSFVMNTAYESCNVIFNGVSYEIW
jgi:hypothetical protein